MKKIKVNVQPSEFGELRDVELAELENAGWSDDPGTGSAVLLPDERDNGAYEVVSPLKFAPPIGYQPTPPIEELIQKMVFGELNRLRGEEVIDSKEEENDFDIDDDLPPIETIYEVIAMKADTPRIPEVDPKAELTAKARADLDYWEAVDKERLLRKRHREATIKAQQDELALSELYSGSKTGS